MQLTNASVVHKGNIHEFREWAAQKGWFHTFRVKPTEHSDGLCVFITPSGRIIRVTYNLERKIIHEAEVDRV